MPDALINSPYTFAEWMESLSFGESPERMPVIKVEFIGQGGRYHPVGYLIRADRDQVVGPVTLRGAIRDDGQARVDVAPGSILISTIEGNCDIRVCPKSR